MLHANISQPNYNRDGALLFGQFKLADGRSALLVVNEDDGFNVWPTVGFAKVRSAQAGSASKQASAPSLYDIYFLLSSPAVRGLTYLDYKSHDARTHARTHSQSQISAFIHFCYIMSVFWSLSPSTNACLLAQSIYSRIDCVGRIFVVLLLLVLLCAYFSGSWFTNATVW